MKRLLRLTGSLAVALLPQAAMRAQTVFTNIQTGAWSEAASWSTGAPAAGGSNDYSVVFANAATASSTNDLGAPSFVLNRMAFNGAGVTLSGNPLVFATASDGVTGPQLVLDTATAFTIRNELVLSNSLLLADTGSGSLTLHGTISGPGAFARGGTNNSTVTVNGTNTYTGGTFLTNGTLLVNGFIPGDVTINDGQGPTTVRLGAENVFESTTRFSFEAPVNLGSIASFVQLNGHHMTFGGITNSFFADKSVIENQAAGTTSTVTFALTSPSHFTGKIRDNNIGGSGRTKVVVDGPGTLNLNVNTGAGSYSGGLEIRRGILSVPSLNEVNTPGNLGTNSVLPVYVGYTNGSTGTLQFTGGTAANGRSFALGIETGAVGGVSVTDTAATLTLTGPLSGPGTLLKDGPGRLRLWGTNGYSGGTLLQAGTLTASNDTTLGTAPLAPATNITFASNAILQAGSVFSLNTNRVILIADGATATFDMPQFNLTVNGPIVGDGALAKTGAAAVLLGGANSYTGGTTLLDGTLSIATDTNLGGDTTPVTFSGGMLQVTGTAVTNLDRRSVNWSTFNGGFDINAAGHTFFVTNAISGSGPVRKGGNGTLRLSGANTHTGLTTVSAGQLLVANPMALGMAEIGTTVVSGGHVALLNGIIVTGEVITVAGNGANNGGSLQSSANATNEWQGNVVLSSAARLGSQQNGQLTIRGPILNTNFNTLELGAGTGDTALGVLVLAGQSTYNGYTRLVRGTVKLGIDQALPSTTTLDVNFFNTVTANAVFDLNGFNQVLGGLARSSTGSGGSIVTNSSAVPAVLTVAQASNTIFTGALGGNLGLTKAGAGTLDLVASGVLSGPMIVSNGVLLVDGNLGTGAVTVAAGGTLGGTGVVSAPVTSAGVVAPGRTIGQLTLAQDYSQQAGGGLAIEVGGVAVPGVDYDQLAVSGNASLDGTLNLILTNGFTPAVGDSFVILTAAGISGTFSGINPPTVGTNAWTVGVTAGFVILSVTNAAPATGYDAYAQQIANPALRGPQADADGDGYANLLEYATGGHPTNIDTVARMNAARTNGALALVFTRNTTATDATLVVEAGFAATNEAPWTGIATNSAGTWSGPATVVETGGPNPVFVTVADTAPSATNRFLRLRVTRP